MRYALRELFDNLEITLTELKRRSGISDVTLISIRNGKSARRSTINTLLRTFSDIYGVKLTLQNVEGIIIQGKPVNSSAPITHTAEKTEIPPVCATSETPRVVAEKVQKRTYKAKDTVLPEGCILASKFAESHGVARPTFIDHMTKGMGTDKGRVDYSERPKPGRPKEKERYLTPEQQHEALKFWQRHDVDFKPCNRFDCWCHTVLNQAKEKLIEEERPWYAPDGE